MEGFSEDQTRALKAKLREAHIRQRREDGVSLSYVEGWHVVAEANRIFGFEGWDRETVESTCIWQGSRSGRPACSYVARVRISVRAGDSIVTREGSGSGHGDAFTLGEAHENALKEAETDATKRALSTFGNAFGLALYDRDQRGVTKPRNSKKSDAQRVAFWPLMNAAGAVTAQVLEPIEFCRLLKIQINAASEAQELTRLHHANRPALQQLRRDLPALRNDRAFHYADLVEGLFAKRVDELQAVEKSDTGGKSRQRVTDAEPGNGKDGTAADTEVEAPTGVEAEQPAIDKSLLFHGEPKRIRDPEHRRFVAKQPCVVCGRQPSQAHHLRFAQPRAMARKVSDAWTVPLCATHHRQVHEAGDEETWWGEQTVDPRKVAEELWRERCQPLIPNDAIFQNYLPEPK